MSEEIQEQQVKEKNKKKKRIIGFIKNHKVISIIIALVFSMFIGIVFGYAPANKAAKLNPIDALRYE